MCETYEIPEKEVVHNKKLKEKEQQEEKPLMATAWKPIFIVIAMNDLKNQASKIKQEQEMQLDEIIKISVEQKSANEIINTYEKEKRKLEELSGINLTQDI